MSESANPVVAGAAAGAIAIMTSGGDAPGMNACLRGAVRAALSTNREIYAILEGYQGLIAGWLRKLEWEDVSGIIGTGGTAIGTARSAEFRERSGRLAAARNLARRHIDRLIVIGGDGSLSGAEQLRSEWSALLGELIAAGELPADAIQRHPVLTIAGAVGSIDNDMAETDMTIGADTALHRIVDAVDAITSTAYSHQRTFIVEVMGRNCGYLALMSAIAAGASWCFIPEAPPEADWPEQLVENIRRNAKAGRRVNIIIVAEGARDRDNRPISAIQIQQELESRGQVEARVTILGHVQRGGTPSAFDRYMSTLLGVEAVRTLDAGHAESQLVALRKNRVGTVKLTEAVAQTRAAAAELAAGHFEQVSAMRGAEWQRMVRIQHTLTHTSEEMLKRDRPLHIGIVTAGRAASGMNSAARILIRLGLAAGCEVIGIEGGPAGLVGGKAHRCGWMEPELWDAFGGSRLGAGRDEPHSGDTAKIAANFRQWGLNGLILLGDWSGYQLLDRLVAGRSRYPEFNIPMIAIPASINNDLPGSEYSLGCDTALNAILDAIDKIKDSTDTAKRAYVVEVMGRNSGYLAMIAGLASGAEYVYIPETGITLDMLRHDVRELTAAFRTENRHTGLIIRSENADPHYTTDFVTALFEADGGDEFDVRKAVLGPIQQGGRPTPYDRIQAVRFACGALRELLDNAEKNETACGFLGLQEGELRIHPWNTLRRFSDPWLAADGPRWWHQSAEIIRELGLKPGVKMEL